MMKTMKMKGSDTSDINEHDKALIDRARSQECYRDFGKVHALMREAETKKGKEILHGIASDYYHAEEWSCGML